MRKTPIVVVSDPHFSANITRPWLVENYLDDLVFRMRQVVELCNSLSAQMIITGDVFDVWNEGSPRLFNGLTDVLREAVLPVATIIGNHDILQGVGESLNSDENGLGYLLRTGLITRLTPGSGCALGRIDVIDWHDPRRLELEKGKITVNCDVLIAHAKIGPTKEKWCTGVHDIDVIGAKWLLLGDQHKGHGTVVTPSGCKVINPGGFSLKSSDEVDRVPRVCVVYSDREEYIEFPVQTKKLERKIAAKKLSTVKLSVADGNTDLIKSVVKIGKQEKFSQESIDLLVQTIKGIK